MSLLTQFYNCTSSGGTTPSGVPSMGVGGFTSNNVSQAYVIGTTTGTGNILSAGTGWTIQGSSTSGGTQFRNYAVNTVTGFVGVNSLAGVPSLNGGLALNTCTFAANPTSYTNNSVLVFENISIRAGNGATLTLNDLVGIYGLYWNNFFGGSFTQQFDMNQATGWYYGQFTNVSATCGLDFNGPLLTDVTTCNFILRNTATLDMNGTALSSASVDHVLAQVLATQQGGGTLNLAGGCAPPSAAGLASKTALIAAGYVVTTN